MILAFVLEEVRDPSIANGEICIAGNFEVSEFDLRCSQFSLEVRNPSILGVNFVVLILDSDISALDLSVLALGLPRFSKRFFQIVGCRKRCKPSPSKK